MISLDSQYCVEYSKLALINHGVQVYFSLFLWYYGIMIISGWPNCLAKQAYFSPTLFQGLKLQLIGHQCNQKSTIGDQILRTGKQHYLGMKETTYSIHTINQTHDSLMANWIAMFEYFNPLTPGTFCKKCIFWTFWQFLGWISAELPLIRLKMRLQHNSLPFLPPASLFTRFVLFWALQIPWRSMTFSMTFSSFPRH